VTGDFAKYEALGNDYLIVDPTRTDLAVTGEVARRLCDRRRGVGADGVLYGPFFEGDAVRLRIFNSDGSECEKSGNGLRMFARYLLEHGHVSADRFVLRTLAGDAVARVVDLAAGVFTITMGTFTFDSERLPALGPPRQLIRERIDAGGEALEVTCVNVGNPHCVIVVDRATREQALRLGPAVSGHELFPGRVNVQFASVRDRRNVDVEVWERGSGYTLASGSSACAVACAGHALGLTERAVTVRMPGGELTVEIAPSGEVLLTGEALAVAEGVLAPALRRRLAALA
jgi:diaminopimelate epimerase